MSHKSEILASAPAGPAGMMPPTERRGETTAGFQLLLQQRQGGRHQAAGCSRLLQPDILATSTAPIRISKHPAMVLQHHLKLCTVASVEAAGMAAQLIWPCGTAEPAYYK